MDKSQKTYDDELSKARAELAMLYEISNAMRTTLQLDEILYIILTGVTSHVGLGFNRAMLFLIHDNIIEGQMGIGPTTWHDADRIWKSINVGDMTLDDFISVYKSSREIPDSNFNSSVKKLIVSLDKENNLLAEAALDNIPNHIKRDIIYRYKSDPLFQVLGQDTEELIIVPLRSRDRVNGLIVADNLFTHQPITQDHMRMLLMLSNQAGLAIENSQLYLQTVKKSHTDALTNLWNHGFFQSMLQDEFLRARASKSPLSLIMIDIDVFKNYNDSFGHQAGDQLLTQISKIFQDYSRKIDYVCRYGGEEFSIILPQTNRNDANIIAERLRKAIEDYNFTARDAANQKITISLGVATFPESATDKDQLLLKADSALFTSKKEGRNKTTCA